MLRVERHIIPVPELRGQRVHRMPRNTLPHPPIRIDRRRHPVVRIAQQPPPVLNRSHPRHVQVLPRSTGVAIPGVIADVDQHLSAILRELPHLIRKNRLVADEDAVAAHRAVLVLDAKDRVIGTAIEPRDAPGKLLREEQQLLKRNILAERNQVNLVVASDLLAVGAHHHRRIELPPALLRLRVVHANATHNQRRPLLLRDLRRHPLEGRIDLRKRRR